VVGDVMLMTRYDLLSSQANYSSAASCQATRRQINNNNLRTFLNNIGAQGVYSGQRALRSARAAHNSLEGHNGKKSILFFLLKSTLLLSQSRDRYEHPTYTPIQLPCFLVLWSWLPPIPRNRSNHIDSLRPRVGEIRCLFPATYVVPK